MRGKLTLKIDPIGSVLFESSKKARRIGITVRPFLGVRVAVPYGVPLEVARDFAATNTGWIQKQILQADKIELKAQAQQPVQLPLFAVVEEKASKAEILARLAVLAKRHGLGYNKSSVRRQRTLWGSCSPKGNISLNLRLTRLPSELMDYVIVHELVHTKILNHSTRFWTELERLVPNSKTLDKKLREHRPGWW
jgi:hypothetical protein